MHHFPRLFRSICLILLLMSGGCSYLPFFGKDDKPAPLPVIQATVKPRIAWQVASGGGARPGFAPAVTAQAVYAATPDGTLIAIEPQSGKTLWRHNIGQRLSAGIGADHRLLIVGTARGDVLAFDGSAKPLWQAKVSSEIVSPPKITENMVVVWSGDGRIYGFTPSDGARKWIDQRSTPPLTVRNYAGGNASAGTVYSGLPAGKLLALDANSGSVSWEATVSVPRGATELERIADVTSLPVIDDRQVCAAAYQGRVACFELSRGNLNWSREISSLHGLVIDARALYLTDDKGYIHALDKATGASVWKQDKLAGRRIGAPQLFGQYLAAVDVEGFVHVISKTDGSLLGFVATDGSAPVAQPAVLDNGIVVQTRTGTVVHLVP